MNKWEKVFYKEQFCEVHMKLEENLRQQNEIYEKNRRLWEIKNILGKR